MKTIAALALAFSSLVAASEVQAQDRQVTIYNGPMAVELPASMLRGSETVTAANSDTRAARKVRIVLQSPYSN